MGRNFGDRVEDGGRKSEWGEEVREARMPWRMAELSLLGVGELWVGEEGGGGGQLTAA